MWLELAAGDVVSGGGRFVSGLIMWATLAVGIAAGAALVDVRAAAAEPAGSDLSSWVVWPAVVVLAIGVLPSAIMVDDPRSGSRSGRFSAP